MLFSIRTVKFPLSFSFPQKRLKYLIQPPVAHSKTCSRLALLVLLDGDSNSVATFYWSMPWTCLFLICSRWSHNTASLHLYFILFYLVLFFCEVFLALIAILSVYVRVVYSHNGIGSVRILPFTLVNGIWL